MSGLLWQASYAALWIAVVVLAVVIIGLLRQVGVLHERLAARGAEPVGDGLPVGTAAPMPGRLGYGRARATLLAFTSSGSAACDALGPVLERIERQYKGVRVVEVPFGARTREVFASFNVTSTPRLMSVDRAGVVRGCGVARTLEQAEVLLGMALDGGPIPPAEAEVDLRDRDRDRDRDPDRDGGRAGPRPPGRQPHPRPHPRPHPHPGHDAPPAPPAPPDPNALGTLANGPRASALPESGPRPPAPEPASVPAPVASAPVAPEFVAPEPVAPEPVA
ncbi:MAG TPA: hypothetical protein VFA94_14275, partial [Acidimicrobiales bacterium]|nr:hypothetical protein [Acidimicrobiales bacterium]